jgi:hypothetical protein
MDNPILTFLLGFFVCYVMNFILFVLKDERDMMRWRKEFKGKDKNV